ncbi:hypothetical protein [Halomonas sp. BM-2019]|uniref:hypothetical protein n=1 Tax=Halomonas sp. BM-2019 TaxID=2811227 RepID=UPI001B3C3A58|nr:MAG: hypothetical protein J5F18_10920 [Halomonas sp. BM-2019]
MSTITLDRHPFGAFILNCRCGNIEIGRGEARWQAFLVAPLPHDLAQVTCRQCEATARLHHPVKSPATSAAIPD